MMAPGIEVRGLSLRFGLRPIFDNLTFSIPGGQWSSLLGASGAGKTSLLRIIAGLAKASGSKFAPAMAWRLPDAWRGWGKKICFTRG